MRTTIAALTVVLGMAGLMACGSEEPAAVPTTTTTVPQSVATTTTTVPTTTPRKPHYVIVDKDGPVPNIEPPTKLYVRGLTEAECDGMGGTFDAASGMCRNVDY